MFRLNRFWIVGFVLALAAGGCQRSVQKADERTGVELEGTSYKVTGPYQHENLAVFLLHADSEDDRDFITLDQGLKDGVVKVTEQEQSRVRELQIENQSDSPLFLQEGDRLQGGKQDRTIIASMVVPPQSGKMPVPTFCIERSRWQAGAKGAVFEPTMNAAFAPKEVRVAAKIDKSQESVWENVRQQKESAKKAALAGSTNSSLNETLDAPEVKKLSDEFAEALKGVLQDHPDAVGVAVAVNGNIEEVNIYPNHKLLCKIYPRLLQSYALQATLQKDKAKDAKAVAPEEIVKFMADSKEKSKREEKINADNRLDISDLENNRARCATIYNGRPVHKQVVAKNAEAPGGRGNGPRQTNGDNINPPPDLENRPRPVPQPNSNDVPNRPPEPKRPQ
jgi:hypothetical protein